MSARLGGGRGQQSAEQVTYPTRCSWGSGIEKEGWKVGSDECRGDTVF